MKGDFNWIQVILYSSNAISRTNHHSRDKSVEKFPSMLLISYKLMISGLIIYLLLYTNASIEDYIVTEFVLGGKDRREYVAQVNRDFII